MSTIKSPPTQRVVDVITALANSPAASTLTELARTCAITTSTCSLLLHDLEQRGWVHRREDRRYALGTGLLPVVHGLRRQHPLLDKGRDALLYFHEQLGAACSLSKIGSKNLAVIDSVGHPSDTTHDLGQRFPIDPPFGLVAMAWRDRSAIDQWLRQVEPRLTRADIDRHVSVLADIRGRGYGAWRFDDDHPGLHERLTAMLESVDSTSRLARQLTTLMTIVSLQSVTATLESNLPTTEFVVVPIFGRDGQPEYQIQIHLGQRNTLSLEHLDGTLKHVQERLVPAL